MFDSVANDVDPLERITLEEFGVEEFPYNMEQDALMVEIFTTRNFR